MPYMMVQKWWIDLKPFSCGQPMNRSNDRTHTHRYTHTHGHTPTNTIGEIAMHWISLKNQAIG